MPQYVDMWRRYFNLAILTKENTEDRKKHREFSGTLRDLGVSVVIFFAF